MRQARCSVGLIGCGTIGTALAEALAREHADVATVVALSDANPQRARRLGQRLSCRPAICSIPQLVRRSDLVIETASGSIAADVACRALAAGRSVLIMSTGGLLAHWSRVLRAAVGSRGSLVVPSGGLGGLDGIKAFAMGRITRLTLTTHKPPKALLSAPYVRQRRVNLLRLRKPRVIFSGTPAQAVRGFPQNTNVAGSMLLAAIPSGRAQVSTGLKPLVRVIADPSLTNNVHELAVESDCGRFSARMESRPSRANPKTSEVAIRSAQAALAQLLRPIRVGT